MFILIGARVFSLTFYGVNGHIWVEELLTGVPGGELGFLIIVNVLVFVLAFFLDFFELAFIIVPLLAPVADKLGIDLIWFGVLLGVNMQTSFMHPPFGFALFYLRSVAPRVPYLDRITRKTDRAGHHRPDLLGRRALRASSRCIMVAIVIAFPQTGAALQGRPAHRRSGRHRNRRARFRCRRHRVPADRRPSAATDPEAISACRRSASARRRPPRRAPDRRAGAKPDDRLATDLSQPPSFN